MADRMPRSQRMRRRLFGFALLACMGSLPSLARAANRCPWMTEATASGLIGADSVGSYSAAIDAQPAVCTFIGGARSLTVTVEIAKDPHARMTALAQQCASAPAPLHAIGNEAVSCEAPLRSREPGARALGRVRDQVFTITLKTRVKEDPILTRDALKARIYTAAEQVAGNLF